MPTYNRRAFIPHAIRYFLQQEYENKELIIIDDGSDAIDDLVPDHKEIRYFYLDKKITLGAKLNLACNYAAGNIIVHWDDDDWYAPRRLAYQVESLQQQAVDVCGINRLLYYNLLNKKAFEYVYPSTQRIWLLGSSLCYKKELWCKQQFADIDVGMDGLFVWATPPERVAALSDSTIAVHMIHEENISPKRTDGSWWYAHGYEEIKKIMGDDWDLYSNEGIYPLPVAVKEYKIYNTGTKERKKKIKNIYACLVHENEDCIIDLVRNLHYHDPDSAIILYNGGENINLLKTGFPYDKFGVVIFPGAAPLKWGYLHDFALKCMEFALANMSFDTFTIVDSDQLCIRKGYTDYLGSFLHNKTGVGMLSSVADRITADNKTNPVALQAFKEYELWKPLLQSFPGGENNFAYWTFWPSTVFTVAAARDLVQLFKENELLAHVMKHTKIWATEEVILPTLIKLLGYEIEKNPCSYDYVKYKVSHKITDIESAIKRPDAYWMHPVNRKYEDPIRKHARQHFHHYVSENNNHKPLGQSSIINMPALLNSIEKIEGWLSVNEAKLLASTVLKACKSPVENSVIMEVGSYHGKATVLLGNIVKAAFPGIKIISIDPHEGKLGAMDQELVIVKPSFDQLKINIQHAGLSDFVDIIKDHSFNVAWNNPIQFLLIDGLHDYPNVSRDFWHFSHLIIPGGYIAFHDYADYYPGVKAFVNELLQTGDYSKIDLEESLIILQKK